ncbi:MAG: glycosyltransferase family 2 protein, partial [Planctomycetia bacterium]
DEHWTAVTAALAGRPAVEDRPGGAAAALDELVRLIPTELRGEAPYQGLLADHVLTNLRSGKPSPNRSAGVCETPDNAAAKPAPRPAVVPAAAKPRRNLVERIDDVRRTLFRKPPRPTPSTPKSTGRLMQRDKLDRRTLLKFLRDLEYEARIALRMDAGAVGWRAWRPNYQLRRWWNAGKAEGRLRGLFQRLRAEIRPNLKDQALAMVAPDPLCPPLLRRSARMPFAERHRLRRLTVDVVVCVHNALDDVKACLASVVKHRAANQRIVLVDDASEPDCRDFLAEFAAAYEGCTLRRFDRRQGYTRSANEGLKAATGDYVVLLNSDTIVSAEWADRLMECGESEPAVGVVSPTSNAAYWQSAPWVYDPDGALSLNPLPAGWTPETVADAVAATSPRLFPRVGVVNGFCFAVKRAVLDRVGLLDEEGFPDGYGEEHDYCIRAVDAGFQLAVADHAYVFHAKSKSYGNDRKRELSQQGVETLRRKHGEKRVAANTTALRNQKALTLVRQEIANVLDGPPPASVAAPAVPLKLLVVAPARPSLAKCGRRLDELLALRDAGVDACFAAPTAARTMFDHAFRHRRDAKDFFHLFQDQFDLGRLAAAADVTAVCDAAGLRHLRSLGVPTDRLLYWPTSEEAVEKDAGAALLVRTTLEAAGRRWPGPIYAAPPAAGGPFGPRSRGTAGGGEDGVRRLAVQPPPRSRATDWNEAKAVVSGVVDRAEAAGLRLE